MLERAAFAVNTISARTRATETPDISPRVPSRATKSRQSLPKTAAICVQWNRCGKARCRCTRGELHGPYHYRFPRVGGRLQKRYVRLAEVDAAREASRTQRNAGQERRRTNSATWETWRELAKSVREVERVGRHPTVG